MQLEDGRFLVAANRYDKLLQVNILYLVIYLFFFLFSFIYIYFHLKNSCTC